jgi:rhodanese-related sulfurtransferase
MPTRRGGRHPSGQGFPAGHIVGAVNIPQDKLAARMAELEKHKAKTIIVVDAMGQQPALPRAAQGRLHRRQAVRWRFQLESR